MKKMLTVNMVKRVFAVLLAFSLCAGYLLIPAAADEDDGGVVVVTETTTTTSDGVTHTETTRTETQKTEETKGGVTHTETTTTETRTTEETKGGATGGSGNTSEPIETSNTTVTKIEGSETKKEVTDTQGSKTVFQSETVEGEETTTSTHETKTEHTETSTEPAEDNFEESDYTETSTESTTVTELVSSAESTEPVSLDRPDTPNVTLEMTQKNPTDTEKISAAGAALPQCDFDDITEGTTGKETDPDGKTTVTKTPIYKDEEKTIIIGYQVVTTNVKVKEDTQTGNVTADTTNQSVKTEDGKPVTESSTTNTTYKMPEEPKGGVTKNSDGTTVTTTVEKIMEGGEHVGYKTTVVTTDSNGKELNRSSESIYRTEITAESETASVTTTTTTTTPLTNQRTTTTVTTTIVDTEGHVLVPALGEDGNWYWVYTGTLGNVAAGNGNGAINMVSLKPNMTGLKVDTSNDLYNRKGEIKTNPLGDWPLIWTGKYGLESAIRIQAKDCLGDNRTFQPHLFILSDKDNNDFYAYCADFEVSAVEGYRYGMENLEDATYYNNDDNNDAAKHIRYIALNGYWGTNGAVGTPEYTGSLAKVQALMRTAKNENGSDMFTEAEVDGLTPGQAITATQAAIWYYGNSNKDSNSGIDTTKGVVGKYYDGNTFSEVPAGKAATVEKLFNLLISGTQEAEAGTTIINENNFATAAKLTDIIRIVDKNEIPTITDTSTGVTQPLHPEKDWYSTNLSFSLLLEPSQGDELTVTVLDSSGAVLKTEVLCGTDDNSVWHKWLNRDQKQMYTIEGVKIAEGVTITLNLSGTQNLQPGVYLYTSEVFPDKDEDERSSQTFVGVANGQRNVNLNVNLKFEVQDPKLAVKTSEQTTKSTTTDTKVEIGTGERTEITKSKHITVTETVTESTRRTWNSSWTKRFSGNDGGGDSVHSLYNLSKQEPIIPEIPVTGDNSIVWFALGFLSLAGLVLLYCMRKKVQ